MLIETFIRKQLRLKAHTVSKVEETDDCMRVSIDRLGSRLLRCGVCGYGVIVELPPPSCPICRSTAWQQISARPRASRAI